MYVHLAITHTHSILWFSSWAHAPGGKWMSYSSFSFSFIRGEGQFPITYLLYSMDSCHDMPEYILIHQSGRLAVFRPVYTWEIVQGLDNDREANSHLFFKENSNILVFWSQSLSWLQPSLETHVTELLNYDSSLYKMLQISLFYILPLSQPQ